MSDAVSNSTVKAPPGIPYIIGNEAAERFSYYGMKTILVVFMTHYLMTAGGKPDFMTDVEARTWYHTFSMANYFFPIIGALVADIFWGKYKTIMSLSIVYCLGHLTLALFETRTGLSIGLMLIAVGSGGIKPCVSSHVGDQFSEKNKHLIENIFSKFYFAINFGAFFSTLLTPLLLDRVGPSLAFGVPGILMALATFVFWLGRHKFIAIPAVGWAQYKHDVLSSVGRKALINLSGIYLFISVFWSLYDQTGSSWVQQAEKMNRHVSLPLGFTTLNFEILASQIQAINPILIMAFIPLFTYVIYPFIERFCHFTSLRKINAGFLLTALAFALTAFAQAHIDAGETPSILWQVAAYVALTASEVMISITALEFSYTQAPLSMKSLIMGLYLLSVSLGNAITALVNQFMQTDSGAGRLEGASYYWFFTICMLVTAVAFWFVARHYKEKSFIQAHAKPAAL